MEPTLPIPITPKRTHLSRLMKLWRSAGWPSRDAVEIDLLAAGWVRPVINEAGHETLQLTDSGIALLAGSRQGQQRSLSAHDQLSLRMATQLMAHGRIVWLELPLRALVADQQQAAAPVQPTDTTLWGDAQPDIAEAGNTLAARARSVWRMARPDVFSVRHTSVESYLHPMVHEIKVSRADLQSDLRHEAKREAYQWLCSEVYYVFPEGIAEPDEIPAAYGVWLLRGQGDERRLEMVRPARHTACTLPFDVWMALARATPLELEREALQADLGGVPGGPPLPATDSDGDAHTPG